MTSAFEILQELGFTIVPETVKELTVDTAVASAWFDGIDYDEAIRFYELDKHTKFIELFNAYPRTDNLKVAVYALYHHLFAPDHYGWEHYLYRSTVDILPAFILLAGYKKHLENIHLRGLDNRQLKIHQKRIFETCTIGIDTYAIEGIAIPELIWGNIFIHAHIVELGRLQFEIKKYNYEIESFTPPDEFCIGIHIPRGERLDTVAVDDSLRQALKLCPQYYPEIKNPFYVIRSWLLTNDLDELLPDNSNIKSFRQLFKVLKFEDWSTLPKFLFNTTDECIENYPEDTSLRRKVKQKLLAGHKFFDAIGILKE